MLFESNDKKTKMINIFTNLLLELKITKSEWDWISEVISNKYRIVENTSTLDQYQRILENKNEE